MDRDSFVMHRNFLEGIPEEEQFKWFNIICGYAFDNKQPVFENWLEEKIWIHIKDRIECDREAYDKRVEYQKRYYERKKGVKNNLTVENIENVLNVENVDNVENIENFENFDNVYLESRRNTDSVSVSVSDSESDSVSEYESVSESDRKVDKKSTSPQKKGFHKPTLEEIRNYMYEKSYTFSAEAFYNFYESNGWKVGKNPMKSWKSACATWQEREPKETQFDSVSHDDYSSSDWVQEEW